MKFRYNLIIGEDFSIMKNLLLKLRTLLLVLLIIAGGGIILWIIGTLGQLGKSDSGIKGSIAFGILGVGVIFIYACFAIKQRKVTFSEKDILKAEMLKENIRGEITKKHPSN